MTIDCFDMAVTQNGSLGLLQYGSSIHLTEDAFRILPDNLIENIIKNKVLLSEFITKILKIEINSNFDEKQFINEFSMNLNKVQNDEMIQIINESVQYLKQRFRYSYYDALGLIAFCIRDLVVDNIHPYKALSSAT